jgi:hypothetical protein
MSYVRLLKRIVERRSLWDGHTSQPSGAGLHECGSTGMCGSDTSQPHKLKSSDGEPKQNLQTSVLPPKGDGLSAGVDQGWSTPGPAGTDGSSTLGEGNQICREEGMSCRACITTSVEDRPIGTDRDASLLERVRHLAVGSSQELYSAPQLPSDHWSHGRTPAEAEKERVRRWLLFREQYRKRTSLHLNPLGFD